MLLRPSRNTDPGFLLWSMNHPYFYKRVVRGLGATTSPHVNVGDIKSILTPVPLKAEQEFIGKALKRIHNRIFQEEITKQKLQKQKSGLMHDLLTGKVPVKVDELEAVNA